MSGTPLPRSSGEDGSSGLRAIRGRPPASPLRLGIAARMAFAATLAGCLWLAVLWAVS